MPCLSRGCRLPSELRGKEVCAMKSQTDGDVKGISNSSSRRASQYSPFALCFCAPLYKAARCVFYRQYLPQSILPLCQPGEVYSHTLGPFILRSTCNDEAECKQLFLNSICEGYNQPMTTDSSFHIAAVRPGRRPEKAEALPQVPLHPGQRAASDR